MSLSHERLQRKLARCFRFYRSVDSTNDLAKDWLLAGAPDGAVVIADEQRRGRGRQGRVWHSPPGVALALSVVLRPDEEDVALVNMIGALGVYDLVRQAGCDEAGIKWPNDVQVNGKKVSGVLTENVWESDRLLGVVLGIGVNVRVDFAGTDLHASAISLEDVTQAPLDRAELIRQLLRRIDCWRGKSAKETFLAWRRRLNMLGKLVTVNGVQGLAEDVTPSGALKIKTDKAGALLVHAGDVFDASNTWSIE